MEASRAEAESADEAVLEEARQLSRLESANAEKRLMDRAVQNSLQEK